MILFVLRCEYVVGFYEDIYNEIVEVGILLKHSRRLPFIRVTEIIASIFQG
jgi:hypothetical protein